MGLSPEDKERFLRALEEDWVFRYAVLGLLGFRELLSMLNELRRGMEEVKERLDRLVELVDGVNKTLEGIEGKLNRITTPLGEEANDVVTYYLRRRGINIEAGPARLGPGFNFTIYGTNGQLTIVGTAENRVDANFVRHVVERVRDAVKAYPSKFPGRVVIVVYCLRALPGTAERARELGIWLLEEERELTPFPG